MQPVKAGDLESSDPSPREVSSWHGSNLRGTGGAGPCRGLNTHGAEPPRGQATYGEAPRPERAAGPLSSQTLVVVEILPVGHPGHALRPIRRENVPCGWWPRRHPSARSLPKVAVSPEFPLPAHISRRRTRCWSQRDRRRLRGFGAQASLAFSHSSGDYVLRSAHTSDFEIFKTSESSGDIAILYGRRTTLDRGWARAALGVGHVRRVERGSGSLAVSTWFGLPEIGTDDGPGSVDWRVRREIRRSPVTGSVAGPSCIRGFVGPTLPPRSPPVPAPRALRRRRSGRPRDSPSARAPGRRLPPGG